jgi:integrase
MKEQLYCGLDLHKRFSYIVVKDTLGRQLLKGRVDNKEDDISNFFTSLKGHDIKVAVEATSNYYWMYETLDKLNMEVKLSHPLKTKAIADAKIKSDKIDANVLSDLLRADLLPTSYIPTQRIRELRELLRHTPEGIPIPPPKVTEKQIEDLLAYIKKDHPDYYKPTKFMHLVGRRPKETCDITKEDVTTDGLNPLSIQTKPRTAKVKFILPKIIYLKDPELNALIRSALANNKTPWLFPTRDGKKMTANYLWKYLSEISDKVIGIRITAKGFRKLFLTKSNKDGLNFSSMDMANISSIAVMKKRYVGSSEEGQSKLLARNRGDNV